MKNTLYLTLLFIFISLNINAQKSDLIIGKWLFTKALNKEVDAQVLAYMKAEVIGKWKFEFTSDEKFISFMGGEKVNGKWNLETKSNTLILMGTQGDPLELKILKLTESELLLNFELGEFLLTKLNLKS